jgi:transcriptional regulator GlxA family with amidase domain
MPKARPKPDPVRRIGALIFDDAGVLDFTGPFSVFHCAGRHFVWTGESDRAAYDLQLLSIDGGVVRTMEGIGVETCKAPELKTGEFDTLLVVGGLYDERAWDPRIVEWVKRNHSKVRRVASVCTGAYILAAAGLLDGRRATTHWEDCNALARRFPLADMSADSIYVDDGHIWSSAGVTAGIDMALAMVEEDHGRELAVLIARRQVVFLKRPGGQSQFSAPLKSQAADGPMAELLNWIVEHPQEDLRTEALAERAKMSLRNFYRAFTQATGMPPAEWVETARVEIAKRLLEQTAHNVDQVAYRAGFSSYEQLRKAFGRRLAVSPAAYRERFSRPAPVRAGAVDLALLSDAYVPLGPSGRVTQ